MNHRFVLALMVIFSLVIGTSFSQDESSGLTIHVVQRGESLYKIAQAYEVTIGELAEINGLINVNNIAVGQRLLIPQQAVSIPVETVEYITQPGETLKLIADSFGITLDELITINKIANPNLIYPGQVLLIPADATTTTSTPTNNATVQTSVPEIVVTDPANITGGVSPFTMAPELHTILPGETLFKIAVRYGTTVTELARANGIADPTRIYAGQQLIVPTPEIVQNAAQLPSPITDVQVKPLIFTEGETGIIQVRTADAVVLSVDFLSRSYPVIAQENNTLHTIIIGIPMYVEANIYPVTFTITGSGGTTFDYGFNIRVVTGAYGIQNINVTNSELIAPAVEEYEINLLTSVTSKFTPERYFNGPFGLPAAAAMNSPFGTRRSYNNGPVNRFHYGADFATAPSTPVYAAAPGVVVLSDLLSIRGNAVVLDHGWGVYSSYSHMTERRVQLGEFINTGQIVGTAGSTGRITGPHLHWEIWINGVAVNPLDWTRTSYP